MKKKWIGLLICIILLVAFISFTVRSLKEADRPKVVVVLNVEKKIDSGIDIITQDNAKDKLDFLADAVDLR